MGTGLGALELLCGKCILAIWQPRNKRQVRILRRDRFSGLNVPYDGQAIVGGRHDDVVHEGMALQDMHIELVTSQQALLFSSGRAEHKDVEKAH